MKIVHFFNLGNTAYRVVKLLRKEGIDTNLIIDTTAQIPSDHPAWDELEIEAKDHADAYQKIHRFALPKWIKEIKAHKITGRYFTYSTNLINRLKKYDILHAYTTGQLWAPLSGKPYCSWCTGADLDQLAFEKNAKGYLMRKSLKKSKLVLIGPHQVNLARKLCFKYKVNTFSFDFSEFNSPTENFRNKFSSDLLLFSPTSHDWTRKGTQILLSAFKTFSAEFPDCKLLTVNWGIDIAKSKYFLKKHKLENKVIFLPFLSHKLLLKYYATADVVLDQFIFGAYGNIGAEVLASSRPLITYVSEDSKKNNYPNLPIINAKTSQQVLDGLRKLVSRSERTILREQSGSWARKYYDYKKVIPDYIKTYTKILNHKY